MVEASKNCILIVILNDQVLSNDDLVLQIGDWSLSRM